MLPVVQVLGRDIAMYGVFSAIGIFLGIYVANLRRGIYDIEKIDVQFGACYAGIGLFIGAKLLYIITILPIIIKSIDRLLKEPHLIISILTGGLVFYGGLIGAFIGFYLYCKKYKLSLINMIELYVPSIPLIHGFGRIGCFFAGCCYGVEYSGLLHVIFHKSAVAPNGVPLFPVQLIESLINFVAFFILMIYGKKKRRNGVVLGSYLIYYGILRFILEFFRGDTERGIVLGVSTSQWISLLIVPMAFFLIINGNKLILHKEVKQTSKINK